MKPAQYLITTSVAGKSRSTLWDGHTNLTLDAASTWVLCVDEKHTLKLRDLSPPASTEADFDLSDQNAEEGFLFRLPPVTTRYGNREVEVSIRKVKPVTPLYEPLPEKGSRSVVRTNSQAYVHSGVHDFLLKSRRIGTAYGSRIAGRSIFAFGRIESDYKIKSYSANVVFEKTDGTKVILRPGEIEYIKREVFESGTLRYGNFWWRINYANKPPQISGAMYASQEVPETVWFRRVSRYLAIFMVTLGLVAYVTKSFRHHEKKEPAQVTWKQPKLLPPEPKLEIPPEPKPEPPKPKPKPPKPKPEKAPAKKPEVKRPPVKSPVPPPKRAAPTPPPVAAKPTPTPAPAPPPAVSAQKELSKSLSFLSDTKKAPAPVFTTSSNSRYKSAVPVTTDTGPSTLRQMSNKENPQVDLRNTREITADTGIKGKRLNDVKGRVNLDSVYDPNAKGELRASLGKQALSVSGAGSLSESDIQKALAKRLAKFQYCYEKALLSDPSISGIVTLEWTIELDGKATGPKVLKSQIASSALQDCLKVEVGKTPFPKPKGGSVTVRYPFSFSSSSF